MPPPSLDAATLYKTTLPMAQQDKVTEYFNHRADNYLERSGRGLWDAFRKREQAAVIELLAPKPGQKILDAGCGAGFYSLLLKNTYGADVTGVDISERMIAKLEANGITGHLGNIVDFTTTTSFDRILAAGVLEFVDQPEDVFRACFKAVKPGGRMVALVPRAGLAGMAYSLAHQALGCPTQVLPTEEYKKLGEYAGFKFVDRISCTPISLALSWVR